MPTATKSAKKSTAAKKTAKSATTKKAGGKGVSTKAATKKGSKKASPKAAKPKKESGGPTRREELFAFLSKQKQPVSRSQIIDAIGTGSVRAILRPEANAAKPRIVQDRPEGSREVVYSLTPAGQKAVKDGTVSSGAPE